MANLTCGILGILAFVGLLVLQTNVPWANEDGGDGTARTWSETHSGGNFLFSYSNTRGWYDGGWDKADQNAVAQLQFAAPLLMAGTVLVLVGAVIAFGNGYSGSVVALIGGLLTAGAVLLYYLAINDLYDNDLTWQPGLTIALVSMGLALVGGLVGLATSSGRRVTA